MSSLHQLVIDAALRHPGKDAVVTGDATFRYDRLDREADRLARRLRAHGVRHGDRVVVWSEKSAVVVVATQAVLRLGAAYVPADAVSPPARVGALARDCAAKLVLTTADRLSLLPEDVTGIELTLDPRDEPPVPESRINESVRPDDLAYILYTSGSTGAPKGVCVSHRNARAFVDWAVGELDVSPEDRLANHAPFTFDLSVLDLYAAFSAGASVHLIPAELAYAPAQLTDFLYDRGITVWYSVPSALTLMMRDGGLLLRPAPPALRAVLFAGEAFPVAGVRALSGWTDARLLNLYGPTETNVCTFHEVRPADLERDRPVPIGAACSGDDVWARHPDGSVCGPGEQGELVVSGPTVMLGYWNAPRPPQPYPTGDVVAVLADGSFDFVGRRDHQVKVRGHRVELGEVEGALESHPDVSEAAVTVLGTGVDARLTACLVLREGRPGSLALRRHCAERLPRYMIPDEFVVVPALPRTTNGKTDRTVLAARLSQA
ncbi:amino acid adenylation domain-containing protein [Streptomyces sp. NPDC047072]|uniref:amino acid adenylation domain-containing protein n=1 Tax=Streptomyces sp. NPDC047072 TaxID=3154809 RepID=UPI0033ED3A65